MLKIALQVLWLWFKACGLLEQSPREAAFKRAGIAAGSFYSSMLSLGEGVFNRNVTPPSAAKVGSHAATMSLPTV